MLKQRIQGLPPKTIDYQASTADMDALKNLLAGEIEIYEEKASGGGTAMPQLPAKLNAKSFVVGARTPQGRISCLLSVPHMKETSDYNKVICACFW